ncbi:MAG: type I methionyl aminopeptidase [Victivallaceae bacterium]|nr:type I methionyl aminopeptidase [Victivallaceae bacterium]
MPRQAVIIHTPEEIARIRRAAELTSLVRSQVAAAVRPGMTTFDLDQLAGEFIAATGGKSAFLGYCGYPANICISVNDEVVHGIGSPQKVIGEHDIVSVDVGVAIDGGVGDCATTVCLGTPTPDIKRLLEGTERALDAGIAAARRGNHICDISRAVQEVAHRYHLGVVRELVGHGCGVKMHEPPEVPNFVGWGKGPLLEPGMVICIEPMLNLGTAAVKTDHHDHWTVRTVDGKYSAHFENMVLITENEPEILTWQKTM